MKIKKPWPLNAWNDAAATNQMKVLKWLLRVRGSEDCPQSALDMAARFGHLDALELLMDETGMDVTTEAMDQAAGQGYLHIVKWLHDNSQVGCTTKAMGLAAGHGHIDVVTWLHHHRLEGCTVGAMNLAAEKGHYKMVKWLHQNRKEGCTAHAFDMAAGYGHLRVVKFLHEFVECGFTHLAMDLAATNGHLEVVQWMEDNVPGITATTDAMDGAVMNNYLPVAEFLHTYRTEGCSAFLFERLARQGEAAIERMQWLAETRPETYATWGIDPAGDLNNVVLCKWIQENCQVDPMRIRDFIYDMKMGKVVVKEHYSRKILRKKGVFGDDGKNPRTYNDLHELKSLMSSVELGRSSPQKSTSNSYLQKPSMLSLGVSSQQSGDSMGLPSSWDQVNAKERAERHSTIAKGLAKRDSQELPSLSGLPKKDSILSNMSQYQMVSEDESPMKNTYGSNQSMVRFQGNLSDAGQQFTEFPLRGSSPTPADISGEKGSTKRSVARIHNKSSQQDADEPTKSKKKDPMAVDKARNILAPWMATETR